MITFPHNLDNSLPHFNIRWTSQDDTFVESGCGGEEISVGYVIPIDKCLCKIHVIFRESILCREGVKFERIFKDEEEI
jgi:hypothetical protein